MKPNQIAILLLIMSIPGLGFAADQKSQIDILVHALVVCPPGTPTRFVDNGDGTICDTKTGLMWEKKDASDGTRDQDNPHDVDNYYWLTNSLDGSPDGDAFTKFLAQLNGTKAITAHSEQLGGYSDWRLPTSAELQTIVDCSYGDPCINPIFGPTVTGVYWSSTAVYGSQLPLGWWVNFDNGDTGTGSKIDSYHVRAVRGGR